MPETIRIGEKLIGRDEPVYVIAEMACAHDGDVDKAKGLIDVAVSAKADAIQLQFFSRKDLMTPSHEAYNLLGMLEFSQQEWKEIYQYARGRDIQIFACAYDVPSAELAVQLGVDGIKLNSSDLSNPELLEIVARSKIPFTLGTGASTIEEIAQAIETSVQYGGDQIIVMHGMQSFPTNVRDAHINRIRMLKCLFPFPVGYQDHTDASEPISKVIDLMAIGAGATVLEKHITLDRSEKSTDYEAAMEPDELRGFVEMIRMAEKALGPLRVVPIGENERKYRRFQKKSIVVLQHMRAGDVISKDRIGFLRTGESTDLSPVDAKRILGKKVTRDIVRFHPLEWVDIGS